jgi:hypothetical protein
MTVADNLKRLTDEIDGIKARLSIDYDIDIVAVTKTHGSSAIVEAVSAGIRHIGENRVQEAETKFAELENLDFVKHLIGPLQSNKLNKAVKIFDFIQSLENIKTARKMSERLVEDGKTMPALIEIKTSYEDTKFGVGLDNVSEFLGSVLEMPSLEIKGLMTIAPFSSDEREVRGAFRSLFNLREKLKTEYPSADLRVLSMGMSGDYRVAIEEGSNMIRVGSLLFGSRNYG